MTWESLRYIVTVRPLTMTLPEPSRVSPFSAAFGDTVQLLEREIGHLAPRSAILEADFREDQLRQDGLPRATARIASEGIVLSLVGTAHGDLRYPCSTFTTWTDNLRALALALEALRKVDRYGVTRGGEQYAGWKALPSPDDALRQRGRDLIAEHGSARRALLATHPDHGGSHDDVAAVNAAVDAAREAAR